MLLWHGSRLTNWVGILSQGLRVAPPEAPVTGYMVCSHALLSLVHYGVHPPPLPSPPPSPLFFPFPPLPYPPTPSPYPQFGKGVYFADMCSKSANYCFATKKKNDGVLLLCEVRHTLHGCAVGGVKSNMADHCRWPLAPPMTWWPLTTMPINCPGASTAHEDWAKPTQTLTRSTPCEQDGRLETPFLLHFQCNCSLSSPSLPSPPLPLGVSSRPDGCVVPLGPAISSGVNNPRGYTLQYNGMCSCGRALPLPHLLLLLTVCVQSMWSTTPAKLR